MHLLFYLLDEFLHFVNEITIKPLKLYILIYLYY